VPLRALRELARRKDAALSEGGRSMEGKRHERRFAGALDDDAAFARLRRFLGIDIGNRVRRGRQRAKISFDRRERAFDVDLADDERRRVVRMIVRVVQPAQPFGRDAFDVGSPSDRRMVIGVLAKCRADERGVEHSPVVVVVAFEFVTHDRHLRTPVRLRDRRVTHAVRFQFDREVEIS